MTLVRMLAFAPPGMEALGPARDGSAQVEPASAEPGEAKSGAPDVSAAPAANGETPPAAALGGSVIREASADIDTTDWSSIVRSLRVDGTALQLAQHCALEPITQFEVRLLLGSRNDALATERSRSVDEVLAAARQAVANVPAVRTRMYPSSSNMMMRMMRGGGRVPTRADTAE